MSLACSTASTRSARVIALAAKLGVTVTVDSLQSFIGQMRTYGLMVEWWSEATQPSTSTWPQRDKWTADIRELYQSGLRLFRQGRPQHALEYLEMLLEIAPTTPEALELKERVKARLNGAPEAEVSFESLHGRPDDPLPTLTPAHGAPKVVIAPPVMKKDPAASAQTLIVKDPGPPQTLPAPPPSSPTKPETAAALAEFEAAPTGPQAQLALSNVPVPVPFMPTLQEVELGLQDPGPTDPRQPNVVPKEDESPPPPPKKKRRGRRALLFFLLLIIGAAVPVRAVKRIEVEVKPVVLADAKVAGGTFHTLLARAGQHVDVGAPIADLDTDKAIRQKEQLEKEIVKLTAAALTAEQKAKPKATVVKLKEKLTKAEKAFAKASEDDKPKKQKALEKAQKAYDEANGAEFAAELHAQLAAANAKLPGLQKQIDGAMVTAPVAARSSQARCLPRGLSSIPVRQWGRLLMSIRRCCRSIRRATRC